MRYYGCKSKLLSFIDEAVQYTGIKKGSFVDLFAGTTAVSQYFKKRGFKIISNDFLEFSYAFSKTYIELNSEPTFESFGKNYDIIGYLNSLPGKKGFIFDNYCPNGTKKRQYFSDFNGCKIDAIRDEIEKWHKDELITNNEYYYLITSLLEASDRISNISGTYGSFLKCWDKRALKKICLKKPEIINSVNINMVYKQDANELIKNIKGDILYLDPPYNSRQYASNYFILELIAEGRFKKKQNIYGYTGMRPYEEQKSRYCSKREASLAFSDLINNAQFKYIIVSYNDEGIMDKKIISEILKSKGKLNVFEKNHQRYKSINQGENKQKTNERLYIVECFN